MVTLMTPVYGDIDIPDGLSTLDAFLTWRQSDRVPEKLKAHYLRGKVWVDLHMEEFFSHNQIKSALGITLGGYIQREKLGAYVPDGMLLKNDTADLSTGPDAMFVSHEALASGRVRLESGKKRDAVATIIAGSPDVVVEIISPSSEDADTEWLMRAYHDAGIPEYWVIDARNNLKLDIYHRTAKGYVSVRKAGGWVKSPVFGRSFRLTRSTGNEMVPVYSLDIR